MTLCRLYFTKLCIQTVSDIQSEIYYASLEWPQTVMMFQLMIAAQTNHICRKTWIIFYIERPFLYCLVLSCQLKYGINSNQLYCGKKKMEDMHLICSASSRVNHSATINNKSLAVIYLQPQKQCFTILPCWDYRIDPNIRLAQCISFRKFHLKKRGMPVSVYIWGLQKQMPLQIYNSRLRLYNTVINWRQLTFSS